MNDKKITKCKCGSTKILEQIDNLTEFRTHRIVNGVYRHTVNLDSEQAQSSFKCGDCGTEIDFDTACGLLY
jgi:hypothetical protein